MKKQVVLLVSHFIDSNVISKYKRIREELNKENTDVFLLLNTEYKNQFIVPKDIACYSCDIDDLNSLEYESIEETILPGSCHFTILKFSKDNPQYSYYWFIEYDVEFTGTWSLLIDTFSGMKYDFISSHIEKYNDKNSNWSWWHNSNNVGYPLEKCVKGFNPICRYSFEALKYIDKYQREGHSAHSEVMITTCLYNAGFTIADFGGKDEFVPEGFYNKFYIDAEGTNNGTMRYRPLFTKPDIEKAMIPNKLFHPLKF